jgi:radical SAM superfamily enzyme YgiQ (UPF0313 family)
MAFRVLMVSPYNHFYSSYPEVQKMMSNIEDKGGMAIIDVSPHIGLLTLAAHTDAEIVYVDERYSQLPLEKDYDLVAISALTHQFRRAIEIANHYRGKKSQVILGGTFPSLSPEMARPYVDSIVKGHAIHIWPQIVKDAQNHRLSPLYADAHPAFTFPVPRYDLVDPAHYRSVAITVGEGCPHGCEFCSIPVYQGKTYRHRSTEEIVRDLEAILKRWPKRPFIFFSDENLFTDRAFIKELLHALIPYRIKWSGKTFVDIFRDAEMLSLIKKSGGQRLLIGFESVSVENLNEIDPEHWKAGYLPLYHEAIETIQSYGISIMGQFLLGLDQDSPETFSRLEQFVSAANLSTPLINFPRSTEFCGSLLQ